MKKIIVALLLMLPFLSDAQDNKLPFKKNSVKTTFLPVLKKGYRPQMGIALLGGMENFSCDKLPSEAKTSSVYGVEISLQCPLLCTKKNYIRQQLTIMSQDHVGLKTLAVELNPQYRIVAKPKYDIGVGPSIGLIFANFINVNKTVFSYGLGCGASYYLNNNLFVGVELRYVHTADVTFNDESNGIEAEADLTNFRYFLKLGYRF
jgi:opacity protein-like surface antigen